MKRKDRELLVKTICETIETAYGSFKTIDKFDTKNARSVLDIAEAAITMVEDYSDDVEKLSSSNKKTLVVDILNHVINVRVKYIPKIIREKIEGDVIEVIIEFIIAMFNKYIGKQWLKRGKKSE